MIWREISAQVAPGTLGSAGGESGASGSLCTPHPQTCLPPPGWRQEEVSEPLVTVTHQVWCPGLLHQWLSSSYGLSG